MRGDAGCVYRIKESVATREIPHETECQSVIYILVKT